MLRGVWEAFTADTFWDQVKEVRWSRTGAGGAGLTLNNPSEQAIQLVGVLLRQAPSDGSHGAWRPAERLVLTARRGEPTILAGPVLRPAVPTRARPGEDLTFDLPGTVTPSSVEAMVLTGLFEGKAVKRWRVDEQGEVEVLRDDTIFYSGGDLVDGVFRLLGSIR